MGGTLDNGIGFEKTLDGGRGEQYLINLVNVLLDTIFLYIFYAGCFATIALSSNHTIDIYTEN